MYCIVLYCIVLFLNYRIVFVLLQTSHTFIYVCLYVFIYTGTLYVDSIMSRQDDSAVIKCLCIIIRTHMMKSLESNITPSEEFSVFQDENIHTLDPSSYSDAKQTAENVYSSVPSLEAIINYFNYIFKKAMMESECIIMTLIYIERLFIATTGMYLK